VKEPLGAADGLLRISSRRKKLDIHACRQRKISEFLQLRWGAVERVANFIAEHA
jgi:hypothetical protein